MLRHHELGSRPACWWLCFARLGVAFEVRLVRLAGSRGAVMTAGSGVLSTLPASSLDTASCPMLRCAEVLQQSLGLERAGSGLAHMA